MVKNEDSGRLLRWNDQRMMQRWDRERVPRLAPKIGGPTLFLFLLLHQLKDSSPKSFLILL